MPKYTLKETRLVTVEYDIEAETEDDAKQLNGEILSETETDSIPYEILECNEYCQ